MYLLTLLTKLYIRQLLDKDELSGATMANITSLNRLGYTSLVK